MKTYRVSTATSLFLAALMPLAGVVLAQNPRSPSPYPQTPPTVPQTQTQTPGSQPTDMKQEEVKTFSGKISMSNGKYVLQDKTSNSSYVLDNQKKAKKFEGQNVLVTGTLDTNKNKIHVKKIEAA